MRRRILAISALVITLALMGAVGWMAWDRLGDLQAEEGRPRETGPVPVEVAEVVRGPIERRRVFSGTLESRAQFEVAPKVGGRIVRLEVDLADEVVRGQVVAELDSDEYRQEVAQAEADLAVAQANQAEATSALEIANRELERIRTLQERGVTSESQFDVAQADQLAKQARLEVAKAQVVRAESALQTARIRLGYTTVIAKWSGGDERRVVAERFVEEGDTVAPNTALMSIVELNPIQAVVYVTERDYAHLAPGQPVSMITDAFPGERFEGEVSRVAPVFRQSSRQARVELTVSNPERRLKPGMFMRAETILNRVEDAVIVPEDALVKRDGRTSIFVVDPGGETVSLVAVETGIEDQGRVQVLDATISGYVVTLGQQLLDDGSAITMPHLDQTVSLGAAAQDGARPE